MKCDKCGYNNPDNALYCMNCGEKIFEEDETTIYEYNIKDLENENYENYEYKKADSEIDFSNGYLEDMRKVDYENQSRKGNKVKPIRINENLDLDDDIVDRDKNQGIGSSKASRLGRRIFLIILLLFIAASSFLILMNINEMRDLSEKAERLRTYASEEPTEDRYVFIAEDFLDTNKKQLKNIKSLSNKDNRYGLINRIEELPFINTIKNTLFFGIGMGEYGKMMGSHALIEGYHAYLVGHMVHGDIANEVSIITGYEKELHSYALSGDYPNSSYLNSLILGYESSINDLANVLKNYD